MEGALSYSITINNIAKDFKKQHQHVTQSTENLISENSLVKSMFEKTTYLTERGCEYKEYIIMRGVKPLALAVGSVKKFCGLSTLGGTL